MGLDKRTEARASAFAIRTSERLSPSVRARRRKTGKELAVGAFAVRTGVGPAEYWQSAKAIATAEPSLAFPDIVAEEMLTLLADEKLVVAAAQGGEPEIAKALRAKHVRALRSAADPGRSRRSTSLCADAG